MTPKSEEIAALAADGAYLASQAKQIACAAHPDFGPIDTLCAIQNLRTLIAVIEETYGLILDGAAAMTAHEESQREKLNPVPESEDARTLAQLMRGERSLVRLIQSNDASGDPAFDQRLLSKLREAIEQTQERIL